MMAKKDSPLAEVTYPMKWDCHICGRHLLTAFVRVEEVRICPDCRAWTDFYENLALQQGGTKNGH